MAITTNTSEWKSRTKAQLLDDIQIVIEQRDKAIARALSAEADLAARDRRAVPCGCGARTLNARGACWWCDDDTPDASAGGVLWIAPATPHIDGGLAADVEVVTHGDQPQ